MPEWTALHLFCCAYIVWQVRWAAVNQLIYVMCRIEEMTGTRNWNIKWQWDSIIVHCCIWRQLMHHRRIQLMQCWAEAPRSLCLQSWGTMWIDYLPTVSQTWLVMPATLFIVCFSIIYTNTAFLCAPEVVTITLFSNLAWAQHRRDVDRQTAPHKYNTYLMKHSTAVGNFCDAIKFIC